MSRKFVVQIILLTSVFLHSLSAMPPLDFKEFSIEHLTIDSGISNKTITAIVQDRDGYMWFGTESGLNRYDGYNFKIFKNNPDDPKSLSYNRITSLLCDSKGELWICTGGGGICRYKKNSEDFDRIFPVPGDPDSKANIVLSSFETGNGDIWFGTWGEGLLLYQRGTGTFTGYKSVHGSEVDFSNRIMEIFEDRASNLWIGTRDGLFIFDRKSELFSRLLFRKDPNKKYTVSSIFEDNSGQIWVGTYHGLYWADKAGMELTIPGDAWVEKFENTRIYWIAEDRFNRLWIGSWSGLFEINPEKETIKEYTDTGIPDKVLTSSVVLSAYIDRNGVFWIGTMTGLNFFNGNRTGFRNWDLRGAKPIFSNSCFFTSIFEDQDNSIWLGTLKEGIINFNRHTGEVRNIRAEGKPGNSLRSNVIMNIKGGGNGDLYIGTTGGLSILKKKSGKIVSFVHDPGNELSISDNEVVSIMEYKPGILLIGTMKGFNLLDIVTGRCRRFLNDPGDPRSISANLISFSLMDMDGRVWVGTYGGGLNRFLPESGTFERIVEPVDSGLRRNFIYPALLSRDGMLWMGSNEAGLKIFDPEQRVFKNFSIENGLPSNTVWDVLEDDSGNIWFSTSEGISKMDRYDYSVTNFNGQDGMMINFFNFNSGIRGHSGEMFFSGENGFVSFCPREVEKISFTPPIVLTSVRKLGNQGEIVLGNSHEDPFKFNHGDRMLIFEFSSLSYINPVKNRYKYRLTGLNEEWIDIGTDRSVTFGHLRPGDYTFKVAGSNCFGDWNENGASVKFVVIPAFWQTWWFFSILFAALLAGVFFFYRYKLNVMEKRLRDETDMDKLFRKKKISKREKEIVLLVIQGLTSREIEDKLFISYGTVKNHIYSIYKKLNVKNRAEILNLFKEIKNP